VRIAIEPLNRFETNFVNRHDQALLLAKEVGPDVGVCLDIYHMNQEEADPLQAIRNAGDRSSTSTSPTTTGWPAARAPSTGPHPRHPQGDRLRRLHHRRVRAAARPHAGQPVQERDGRGRRVPDSRAAEVHRGPRLGVLLEEFYSWLVEESIKTLRAHM
jgi:hypothetical protein